MDNPSALNFDIVIVGAGPAGLCFASSLAGCGLDIALVEQLDEARLADPPVDGREIALTHASRQTLERLGIWQRIEESEISLLRDAQVLNGRSPFAMRIGHEDGEAETLGWLVPNQLIRRAAYEAVKTLSGVTVISGARVDKVSTDERAARLVLADGRELNAKLIVAADSRFSQTRRAMGIPAALHDFGKTMLVCRMSHQRPHEHIATEWFGYGQTLALLPLNGQRCSVVLTLPSTAMQALLDRSAESFAQDIERRLLERLGRMQLIGERHVYPLVGVYPRRFVATRYALIGDAAVGMHPVTAHGFNFGLVGQKLLASEIRRGLMKAGDIGSASVLDRYDRANRQATLPLYLATQAIVKLYTDDRLPARLVRAAALRLGNGLKPFRRAIASQLAQTS